MPKNGINGPDDDRGGIPFSTKTAVDPTKNVLDLVAAAMLRQDDLRQAEMRRRDDLFELARSHRRTLDNIVEQHRREIREADEARLTSESRRIDALLAAQEKATALDRQRAEATATNLATQVSENAKNLATQVESTKQALAERVEASKKDFDARIVPLETFRYMSGGERGAKSESRASVSSTVGIIIGIAGVLGMIATIVLALVFRKG